MEESRKFSRLCFNFLLHKKYWHLSRLCNACGLHFHRSVKKERRVQESCTSYSIVTILNTDENEETKMKQENESPSSSSESSSYTAEHNGNIEAPHNSFEKGFL